MGKKYEKLVLGGIAGLGILIACLCLIPSGKGNLDRSINRIQSDTNGVQSGVDRLAKSASDRQSVISQSRGSLSTAIDSTGQLANSSESRQVELDGLGSLDERFEKANSEFEKFIAGN